MFFSVFAACLGTPYIQAAGEAAGAEESRSRLDLPGPEVSVLQNPGRPEEATSSGRGALRTTAAALSVRLRIEITLRTDFPARRAPVRFLPSGVSLFPSEALLRTMRASLASFLFRRFPSWKARRPSRPDPKLWVKASRKCRDGDFETANRALMIVSNQRLSACISARTLCVSIAVAPSQCAPNSGPFSPSAGQESLVDKSGPG